MRLTAKFSLILSLLSSVVLGSSLVVLYFAERQHLLSALEKEQITNIQKLARVCVDSVLDDNELARLTYLKTFWTSAKPGLMRYVVLLDGQGRVLMHSDFLKGDLSLQNKPTAQPALLRAAKAAGVERQLVGAPGDTTDVLSTPVLIEARRVGTVAIAYDRQALDRSIAEIQQESLLRYGQATVAGVALSLLFAVFIARMLTRPIRDLSAGAEKIGRGKLDTRIAAEGKDELGDLAREFNVMAKRLAELDELKEGFLSKITHDLRNPLSAIIGYVELLTMGIQGPMSAEQMNSLNVVLRNGNYLAELINNILDLTKLEAGKMEVVKRPVALRQVADSVVELMAVKGGEFQVGLDQASIPAEVRVASDEQLLKRVLLNLVSNSLKFTPAGGKVFIEWSRLPTGEDRVAVRDTGVGIPKEKLHTLFQKFSQITETMNKVRESKGTGLGLVITKEIVEAHGGRIWVESEYQKGTTFFLALPPLVPEAPPAKVHAG
ncbi:MAG TPA: hypothetical protein DD417_10835 [Elusimicrobia bacterium]|nr:hypothetical protein [Elusimicrobiota bacterium]